MGELKHCAKCGESKPLAAFYRDVSTKDGHRSTCHGCDTARQRERRTRAKGDLRVTSGDLRKSPDVTPVPPDVTPGPPVPPGDLQASGCALWVAVVAEWDLDEHERMILHETCRTSDLCDRLQVVLDVDGPMSESSQGTRVHPAAVELRQQRIVLSRLLVALNLPSGEAGATTLPARPVPGGVRGIYGVPGGAS